ncbi:MAG: M48 family metalloprotease [Gammaproteobacteria bacterium]|jgi:predicted Zn-dependent protease
MPLTRILLFLLPAIPLLLGGCATNPVTGRSDFVLISEAQEISLGRRYNTKILEEIPRYDDPELQALVQQVGTRLAAHSHRADLIYRFTVLDSTAVNAFALPGGYIYITRGMLAYLNSEAEMAAVLGHEIGHVTARHSVRQQTTATVTDLLGAVVTASTGVQGVDTLTDFLGTAVVRGYGREHELEADRLGAEYLARSGYDPEAMLQVVGILKNQETFESEVAKKEGREPNVYHGLFSTHPDNDARFREVVMAANRYKTPATTHRGRDEFLHALDGLVFGDSPRDGIVRNNHFYHRDMNFALTFPEGWRIENRPKKLVSLARGNDGLIQVTVAERNKRIAPAQFMLQRMGLDNLRQGRPFEVAGLTGYTAVAAAGTPWGQRAARFVVLFRDDTAFIFAAAARDRDHARKYDDAVESTAASLHSLTAAERRLATGKKLVIVPARRGMRYAALARESPLTNYPEEQLRLINDQYPEGEPRPPRLIKLVR